MTKDKQGRPRLYGPFGKGRPSPNLKLPVEEKAKRKKAGNRRWRLANKDYIRARNRKWQGLPEPTRPEPTICECCGGVWMKHLNLDHDHTTNKFRGWLCGNCNTAIGKLGDTIEGVLKAVAYLGRTA